MGSSNPESRHDDGPGTQGRRRLERRSLGYWENVVGRVLDGPTTFDSSTCAAGKQETPRFEVVSLTLLVYHG